MLPSTRETVFFILVLAAAVITANGDTKLDQCFSKCDGGYRLCHQQSTDLREHAFFCITANGTCRKLCVLRNRNHLLQKKLKQLRKLLT